MKAEKKKALATRQKNRSRLLDDLIREKEESKHLLILATQQSNEIERLRERLETIETYLKGAIPHVRHDKEWQKEARAALDGKE